jgi:hypothetical protein
MAPKVVISQAMMTNSYHVVVHAWHCTSSLLIMSGTVTL